MKAKEWIEAYAAQLGVEPPTANEFKGILDLAGEAAHGRSASPLRWPAG
jgi:Domain of unknown function (DUF6457)